MINNKLTLTIILFILTFQLFGQKPKTIESIRKELVSETDRDKIMKDYYNLAKLFVLTDFDSAGIYYQKALSLAKDQKNKKLTAEIYLNISKLFSKKSEFTEAEQNCTNAIELAQEIKDDTLNITANLTLAKIKISGNNYIDVLPILEKSLKNAEKVQDSLLISD